MTQTVAHIVSWVTVPLQIRAVPAGFLVHDVQPSLTPPTEEALAGNCQCASQIQKSEGQLIWLRLFRSRMW
jgi:hypothetical protein